MMRWMQSAVIGMSLLADVRAANQPFQREALEQLPAHNFSCQRHVLTNFDPLEWEYIHVNLDKIHELAVELVKIDQLKIADWSEILPRGLGTRECIDYILGLICIDFCHWDLHPEGSGIRNFYVIDNLGIKIRGSAAMTALAKQAYTKGSHIFDAVFMEKATIHDLRLHFMGIDDEGNQMEIPWLAERVKILNEVGDILQDKWNGSFGNMLRATETRAFNGGTGFVELLVKDFPRFQDEYTYRNKKIGIYKLAQLAVMALQSALSQCSDFSPFTDCDALTLCADYQLPRALRALGILEYGPELKVHVDQEKLICPGSPLEIELRMATVFAGEELKKRTNAILADEGKPPITSQELDYFLWSYGRQLDRSDSKHHLTHTFMY